MRGAWLQEGAHLDPIGAFKEDMRESDDAAIAGGTLFVDGREGALKAGDLAQPIAAAVIAADRIATHLFESCRGFPSGTPAQN